MLHNTMPNIKKRPINIFAETKWNGPDVHKELSKSRKRHGLMHFDPNASWNRDPIVPMHFDPSASWNSNTASDMMHRRNLLMQQHAFRGGPQPATFVHGFYDRPALNPSVQAFVPAVPVRLNPAVSDFVSHARRRCFKCGSTGHVQRNCPNRGGKSRKHNKGRKGRKTRRN